MFVAMQDHLSHINGSGLTLLDNYLDSNPSKYRGTISVALPRMFLSNADSVGSRFNSTV